MVELIAFVTDRETGEKSFVTRDCYPSKATFRDDLHRNGYDVSYIHTPEEEHEWNNLSDDDRAEIERERKLKNRLAAQKQRNKKHLEQFTNDLDYLSKNFKKDVFEAAINETELMDEDFGKFVRGAMLGAGLATSLVPNVQAKTDHEALFTNHQNLSKYESGKKGYLTITKDNYGGYSYGKWQISTERRNGKPSTFDFFIKYAREQNPGIYTQLQKAGGQPAAFKGTPEFRETWAKLVKRKDFLDLYDNFILNTQIAPTYDRMDREKDIELNKVTKWGSENSAIQAALQSAIVQHGPNGTFNMIKKIMHSQPIKKPADFLEKLYQYRASRFPKYRNRYNAEYSELEKKLKSAASDIGTVYGKRPGESGWQLDNLIKKLQANPVKVSVNQ